LDKLLQAKKDASADPAAYITWAKDVKRVLKSAEEAELKAREAPWFKMDLDGRRKQLEDLGLLTLPAHVLVRSQWGLTEADTAQLEAAMELGPQQGLLQLVFRASIDDFACDKFKALYKSGKPSLCVIYLENGFIFGGYTSVGWNFSGKFRPVPKAFLFRLSDGSSRRLIILRQHQNEHRATGSNSTTIAWGGNQDLWVSFDKAKCDASDSNLGNTYKCPDGADPQTFLAGSHTKWIFQDIEVYQAL